MKMLRIVRLTAGALAMGVFASAPAFAVNATLAEIAMLPPYCDAKIGSRSAEAERHWDTTLGHPNWIHMHHYCGGLIEMNRYYRQSGADRKFTLDRAMWEFDYVLRYTTPDFSLRAEALTNRGKALLLQGKSGMALNDFQKAIELSPGMPAASIELANLYKKQGKKDEAMNVLKAALGQSPSHKGLRRNYLEMGGNPADIPAATQAPAAPVATPAETPKPAEPPAPAAAPEAAAAKPATVEQKIGNKTNPWCRFCPDGPAEAAKPAPN